MKERSAIAVGSRHRAFSLVEMLTVVSIVVVTAAIVFPVVAHARRSGHVATSLVHMRQVGVGIELYAQDHDGTHPYRHLDPFVETGYVSDPRLLKSHPDAFDRAYGFEFSQCLDGVFMMKQQTTYESAFPSDMFWDWLIDQDENPAILVDRTHGGMGPRGSADCSGIEFVYSGKVLRLYRDTSAKIARFGFEPLPNSPPGTGDTFVRGRLFTDAELQFR